MRNPPPVRFTIRKCSGRANRVLIRPAITAHTATLAAASTRNVASKITNRVSAGAAGSMNWGRNATKKIILFGLRAVTT